MSRVILRGISLLEVIISIGIFILVIGGFVAILIYGFRDNKIIWEQLSTQSEGRKTVQDFTNELRSATYSSIGAYPLERAATTEIIFYTNLDSDSLRERVRYFLSSGLFKKGVIKPTGNPPSYVVPNEVVTTIVHDVANTSTPLFTYYDQDFTGSQSALVQPVTAAQVKVIRINLQLEENPNASPAPFYVEAKAEIRNLKTN